MIKKSFILLFLAVYLSISIQPLLILLSYQLNFEYISTVLCENKDNVKSCCKGKCFVKKEVRKSDKENKEQMISRNDLSDHICSYFELPAILSSDNFKESIFTSTLQSYSQTDTPPPKFS